LEFEKEFSKYVDSKYSVALSNGTAALHIACLALGVSSNTNVITTSLTFSASANCVKFLGGNVWFVDIDRDTYLMDFDKLTNLIDSKPIGFFSGIIPVDFAGSPINLEILKKIANKNKLWVIEDACHAPGAFFIDQNSIKQKSGNGNFSDFSIFSFHPVKHITTGEGGMLTTNNIELYNKALLYRSHGIVRDSNKFTNTIALSIGEDITENKEWPGWYMEMQELGYNYRITDIQAILGKSQLQKAESSIVKRINIVKRYEKAFKKNTNILKYTKFLEGHAYHLYIIEVNDRYNLYTFLKKRGIFTQVHYFPLHLMPYYQQFGWKVNDFPHCEDYYRKCLSLPIYPTLSIKEQEYVIDSINAFFNES
jgi:dTDP-4-amino-4,6-dideoxygalactose transaminase